MQRIFRFAQRVMIAFFVADLVFLWWFGDLLVRRRPLAPHGIFTIAFAAHGNDVFISPHDYQVYWGAFYGIFAIGLVQGLFYWASGHLARDQTAKRS